MIRKHALKLPSNQYLLEAPWLYHGAATMIARWNPGDTLVTPLLIAVTVVSLVG